MTAFLIPCGVYTFTVPFQNGKGSNVWMKQRGIRERIKLRRVKQNPFEC